MAEPANGLSGDLHEFAQSLAPNKEPYKAVIDDLDRILGCSFKIDRLIVGGSFGKRTGLYFRMDLDLLPVFNDAKPPYDELTGMIGEKLKAEKYIDSYHAGIYTVSFTVHKGAYDIKVDLVPVKNMVFGENRENIKKTQYSNTKEYMKTLKSEEKRLYRAGLVEGVIDFVKGITKSRPQIRDLIRLAKCWLFGNIKEMVPGGLSSLFEAIAVHVGQRFQDGSSFNIVTAFEEFLKEVRDIRTLHIVFDKQSMGFKKADCGYDSREIPDDLRKEDALVLDPMDVFNNRLEPFDDSLLKHLSDRADMTLKSAANAVQIEDLLRPLQSSESHNDIVDAIKNWRESKRRPSGRETEQNIYLYDYVSGPDPERHRIPATLPVGANAGHVYRYLSSYFRVPLDRLVLRQRKYLLDGEWAVRVCNDSERPECRLHATVDGVEAVPDFTEELFHILSKEDEFPLIPGRTIVLVAVANRKRRKTKGKRRRKRKKREKAESEGSGAVLT